MERVGEVGRGGVREEIIKNSLSPWFNLEYIVLHSPILPSFPFSNYIVRVESERGTVGRSPSVGTF